MVTNPSKGVSCHDPQSNPPYRRGTITETEETPRFLSFPWFSPASRTDSDSLWTTRPTHWKADNKHRPRELCVAAYPQRVVSIIQRMTGSLRFPLSNFKYFLTLFSKFFSSFPHGTCSLSVSGRYLALDEVYHPFWAAIPSYSTLWTCIVRSELRVKDGIVTLYDPLFQKSYTRVTCRKHVFRLQLEYPLRNSIFILSSSRFTRRY